MLSWVELPSCGFIIVWSEGQNYISFWHVFSVKKLVEYTVNVSWKKHGGQQQISAGSAARPEGSEIWNPTSDTMGPSAQTCSRPQDPQHRSKTRRLKETQNDHSRFPSLCGCLAFCCIFAAPDNWVVCIHCLFVAIHCLCDHFVFLPNLFSVSLQSCVAVLFIPFVVLPHFW